VNPLAKFVGALIIAIALIATLNPYIAGGILVVELACLPFVGLTARRLTRIVWPLGVASLLAALTTALYGRTSGEVLFAAGPIVVSEGSLVLALTIGLRVLAIGLPSIALFATVDPTDLADSLAQLWRLPPRFVFGALAAVRLVDLLVDDWRTLALARRARGMGSGRGPLAAIARMLNQVFALLVSSLRRGNSLALAMDARAFGAPGQRTYARQAYWRAGDTWFVATATLVAVAVVVASLVFGSGVPDV
jgi:energy-coupling factor transport system permease protein